MNFSILNKVSIQCFDKSYLEKTIPLLPFKLLWVTTGKCSIILEENLLNIGVGEFGVLIPGQSFQIENFELEDAKLNVLSFSVDYLQLEAKHFSIDLFKLLIKNSGKKTEKVDFKRLKYIENLTKIIYELDKYILIDQQIAVNLINCILLFVIQNTHDYVSFPDKYFERIHDFFILVFKCSHKEKRVSFYAENLNISSKRLNQILQSFTNHSASHFIQEHNIVKAKYFLSGGKLNITQIATKLGYEDPAYFSRFFKNWVGVSPEKYRNFTDQI